MQFDWIAQNADRLVDAFWLTTKLFTISVAAGFVVAIGLAAAMVRGGLAGWLAWGHCAIVRGTPLIIQLWFIYFGIGSILASMPEVRQSSFWPILRNAEIYALLALSLNFAGYAGEILRGGLQSVPTGEIEAAEAIGMSRWTILRRIRLPRAIQIAAPSLGNEIIFMLKATPLASTVTLMEMTGTVDSIRRSTFLTYETFLFLALFYTLYVLALTGIVQLAVRSFRRGRG
jgi:polar amino acid transport system permease protein